MWVAEADGRVVGFRTFLRWELVTPDGRTVRAVRAVDTATDPEYQGRGIFTMLTLGALDELRADGVEMVFNTPNDKSLPGYLKMGWHEVGRLPVEVRPNRLRFPVAVLGARTAAGRDAVASATGVAAADGLTGPGLDELLRALSVAPGLTTRRTPAFLAWRYGNPELGYRVITNGAAEHGLAVFRLRRRGSAVEAVVCEVLVPGGDPAAARHLVRAIATGCAADYLIRLAGRGVTRDGFVRLPGMGPVLACRPLDDSPPPTRAEWALTMGDVELL
jgi:hypothetical protein